MNVSVDQELCISCGLCVGLEPEIFRFNEDDKSESYQEVSPDQEDVVQEAIDGCPVSAIDWEEA